MDHSHIRPSPRLPPPLTNIWLSRKDLASMCEEACHHHPNETGGVLMGYWAQNNEAVVTELISGGPCAKRDRYTFHPDGESQAKQIEAIYASSGRMHTYLGDWHTHPNGKLALSPTDRRTMKTISRTTEARAPYPLMLILAGKTTWASRIWVFRDSKYLWRQRTEECEVIIY